MNNIEKTFWDMLKNSISYARSNESFWVKILHILKDLEYLEKNEKELSENAQTQSTSASEGHVAQKNQEKPLIAKSFYRLCRNICHLAKLTNNQILLQIVDFSDSAILAGDEKSFVLRLRGILDAARANLADLTSYGVTATKIDELETRLNAYASMPETINLVQGKRKSAKRSIKDLIAEARIILDRLDDAFEGMIDDDKFLEGWFDARKIKGRHHGGKKSDDTAPEDLPPVK